MRGDIMEYNFYKMCETALLFTACAGIHSLMKVAGGYAFRFCDINGMEISDITLFISDDMNEMHYYTPEDYFREPYYEVVVPLEFKF